MIKVRSSIIPKEVEIIDNKVYIASNIESYSEEIDERIVNGYEYDCEIYSIPDYINLLNNRNKDLEQQILDTQMAICDIYENLGGI